MKNIIYSDGLVEITTDNILLRKYYFPTFTSKIIEISDIDFVEVVKPGLFTGKYRIWGTGDFTHWFPLDLARSKRDSIFIVHRKGKKMLIGFTVEDSNTVKSILKNKNLLKI